MLKSWNSCLSQWQDVVKTVEFVFLDKKSGLSIKLEECILLGER